jgi:C4-dicarboxylate-specific signal transduction histidine kinase
VAAAGQFDVGPSGDVELEGIIADITERKAAEQALADARSELARALRLASVGELAGSIIHEINQPLTGNDHERGSLPAVARAEPL